MNKNFNKSFEQVFKFKVDISKVVIEGEKSNKRTKIWKVDVVIFMDKAREVDILDLDEKIIKMKKMLDLMLEAIVKVNKFFEEAFIIKISRQHL